MKATSVRLDDNLMEQIDQLAEALSRSRSWVIAEALKRFVAQEEWFHEAVREGIKAADDGKVTNHEDVRTWVESWGSGRETKRPNS